MTLSSEEIAKIATLARLELSPEDAAAFSTQLSSILSYVGMLSAADTEQVEPMEHVVAVANVFRSDEVAASLAEVRTAALAAFPEHEGDLLKVKAVFS